MLTCFLTGRFITADSSSMEKSDKAILVSPELKISDWSCLRLVYQITGAGSLLAHLRPERENFDHVLWTADKPSDSWLIASMDLRNNSHSFQVIATHIETHIYTHRGPHTRGQQS